MKAEVPGLCHALLPGHQASCVLKCDKEYVLIRVTPVTEADAHKRRCQQITESCCCSSQGGLLSNDKTGFSGQLVALCACLLFMGPASATQDLAKASVLHQSAGATAPDVAVKCSCMHTWLWLPVTASQVADRLAGLCASLFFMGSRRSALDLGQT